MQANHLLIDVSLRQVLIDRLAWHEKKDAICLMLLGKDVSGTYCISWMCKTTITPS